MTNNYDWAYVLINNYMKYELDAYSGRILYYVRTKGVRFSKPQFFFTPILNKD